MSDLGALELGIHSRRKAVKVSGLDLISLSFQTLGVIYSDIGTSPLYVLNGIWPTNGPVPSKEDVIGGVSAIIWSLTLLPLLKYVFISLRFGTQEGEGGSFALYQGLYPSNARDSDADRTLTGDSGAKEGSFEGESRAQRLKKVARWPLLVWCLFGTALTMADGVFTPAISVTSAVGGIAVAKPSVLNDITGISIAFIFALFVVQQFGTARLGFAFSPISFIWFLLLIGTGIFNITSFPGIFRAFDPSRAVLLFVRTRDYDLLAGILLAITGCEAIFANLGQFNALSIQLSFSLFVYPALVLAYLGQGAKLIADGENVIGNVFYNSIPGPHNGALFWIMFIFAILATLVASQAMITATFSLMQQVINMKGFPPIRMIYTSETIQGQVYLPAVNWTLMIATIVIVAAFKSLGNLSNAYGFAVSTVMISTSILLAVQMVYVKRWPIVVPILYVLFFGFFDALFWGAAFKKVPHGAWVPLMIGVILTLIMLLWTWAKKLEDNFDGANRKNLRHFIIQNEKMTMKLKQDILHASSIEDDDNDDEQVVPSFSYLSGVALPGSQVSQDSDEENRKDLARIPTCAIFHKLAEGKGVPHTFIGFIRQWPALPRVVIFLSVCVVPVARVPADERYAVTKVRTVDGFYGVTYYIGFRDDFDVQVVDIIERICDAERQVNPRRAEVTIREIREVSQFATHIAPHYHVVSRRIGSSSGFLSATRNHVRAFFVESLYRRLATMFPETANWLTSADEIIHVGINAVI